MDKKLKNLEVDCSYTIKGILGSGTYGTALLALDNAYHGKEVVLKVQHINNKESTTETLDEFKL